MNSDGKELSSTTLYEARRPDHEIPELMKIYHAALLQVAQIMATFDPSHAVMESFNRRNVQRCREAGEWVNTYRTSSIDTPFSTSNFDHLPFGARTPHSFNFSTRFQLHRSAGEMTRWWVTSQGNGPNAEMANPSGQAEEEGTILQLAASTPHCERKR